jgi:peptidyl-prolyl cis-trans isomerase C/peptidyl-prolyl cis-trans isomerase D
MKSAVSLLFSIVTLFGTSGVARAATELAKINDTVITLEDFNTKYKESLRFFRYKAPTRRNVLDDLINRELGIQEARKRNIDRDPEVRERINTVLYHSLLDKELAAKFDTIRVSDDEIQSYYKKNPEVRTSHIFVQVRYDANAAQEKEALDKIKKIEAILKKGDKSFSEIARTYSEGVAAASGGDIDYQTKDKLDPVYYETAVALGKVGSVSNIIRSQFGYHIIKLTAIKEFKDVDKGAYKRIIFDEKRSKIYEDYMDNLKKSYSVQVNYDLIKE